MPATAEDKELKCEFTLTENKMPVTLRNKNEEDVDPGNTSLAITAYVTAHARIEIYRKMKEVEDASPGSTLFFDTDSIIYV